MERPKEGCVREKVIRLSRGSGDKGTKQGRGCVIYPDSSPLSAFPIGVRACMCA